MKRILFLMIGVLLVGGALPAEAAGSCTKGRTLTGALIDTCVGQVITCEPHDDVSVEVAMTGVGSVEGTAKCGDATANCTASAWIIPNDACADTKMTTVRGVLECWVGVDTNFLGIAPTSWTVVCSVT